MRSPESPLLGWATDSSSQIDHETALRASEILGSCATAVCASNPYHDKRQRRNYDLGATVGGPFAVSFAFWVIGKAKDAGVERLYFLARDGKCIHEACSQLLVRNPLNIELRYLQVARKAILGLADGGNDSPGMSYLAASGLDEARKSAVVDLGWTGSLFKGIAESAMRLGGMAPWFLCVGIESSAIDLSAFSIDAFLSDFRDPRTQRVPAGSVLEVICATDDGPVDAYEMTDNVARPVLKPPDEAARDWGVAAFIDGRSAFIRAAIADPELIDLMTSVRSILPSVIADQIRHFLRQPSRRTALILGCFPHDKSITHDSPNELAPVVKWRNIIDYYILRTSERLVPTSLWREASIARSPLIKRVLIRALESTMRANSMA